MDPTDAETLSDIRASILEALARFGVAGELYVEPSQAVLHGNGPTVTVPLGDLLGAWTSLPYEGKGRRSTMIARELSNQRRGRGQLPSGDFSNAVSLSASAGTAAVGGHSPTQTSQGQTEHRAGPSPPPHAGAQATRRQDPAQRSPREVALATGGGVLLMVLSLGAYALFDLRYGEGNEGQTDTRTVEQRIAADDRERRERASTVCAKTRSRVMRGATIGPADSEGWVVELSLLREEDGEAMLDAPELTQFFAMNEDGVMVYLDENHDYWRIDSKTPFKITNINHSQKNYRMVMTKKTIMGINDNHQLWSFNLRTDKYKVIQQLNKYAGYLSDAQQEQLLLTQIISAKKEIVELSSGKS